MHRVEAYGNWGGDADEAAGFLLGAGPGRHLTDQVGATARDDARRALTDTLRAHEEQGAVRLRGTGWLVTADRPR